MSEKLKHQQAILSHTFHPTGQWIELPDSMLDSTVVACFEEMVERYPNQPAIKMGSQQLTYDELNRAANRVAHAILARCGPAVEPVAMLMRLHVDAIISIFGILKAGKLYTAPDLRHPPERLAIMLANAQPALVITHEQHVSMAQSIVDKKSIVLAFDSLALDLSCPDPNDANPELPLQPDTLFSIVYTSGTTGQPKGIFCTHRAVLHNVRRFTNQVHITRDDRMAFFNYPGFTPRDIFTPLLTGATLFLFDLYTSNLQQFTEWLMQEEITIRSGSLASARQMFNQLDRDNLLPHMRLITTGSEALQASDIALFQQRTMPGTIFCNAYGATETLGGVVRLFLDHTTVFAADRIPAGYSDPGSTVLIVDDAGNPLPTGQMGEIVVRSAYIAQGYWRQPELTATRFRPDPEDSNQRLYFTGDLGILQPDGCLVHMGRKDHQLKIRGYLVEPIEVERALIALGFCREAAVDARPNRHGESVLAAWLVADQPLPSVSEIRQELKRSLPDYMIPAHYVVLPALPLTNAGKTNRKALPTPGRERPALAVPFVPAQTPLEELICAIWRDILDLDEVGIHDPFLDLGGNSLQAMRILSRLEDLSDSALHIQALFDAPTVAEMALYLVAHYFQKDAASDDLASTWETGSSSGGIGTVDEDAISHFRDILSQRVRLDNANSTPDSAVKNPRAIFLLAPPRSGTTLLRVMLAGHPGLFAPPELFLLNYTDLAQRREANRERSSYRLEGSIRALMALNNCAADVALERMLAYEKQSLSTQAFYRVLQEEAGSRMLLDKTPAYASHRQILDRAELWFDEPLYIHLSRHPQGMIHSFLSNNFHLRSELGKSFAPAQLAELTWLVYHQNIRAFLAQIPGHRQLHIRYEDVVKTPDAAMRQICTFLGVGFDSALLTPYDDPQSRMTDGIYPESRMIGDPNFHRFSSVNVKPVAAWQGATEKITLSSASQMLARDFGYGDVDD